MEAYRIRFLLQILVLHEGQDETAFRSHDDKVTGSACIDNAKVENLNKEVCQAGNIRRAQIQVIECVHANSLLRIRASKSPRDGLVADTPLPFAMGSRRGTGQRILTMNSEGRTTNPPMLFWAGSSLPSNLSRP